jgi:hypothetical protein
VKEILDRPDATKLARAKNYYGEMGKTESKGIANLLFMTGRSIDQLMSQLLIGREY